MPDSSLEHAIQTVPAGGWAVGVSGGADSVAMLSLLRSRMDLSLHVIHLDHQTRGQASSGDAEFVQQLARKWNLPITIARRDEVEPSLKDLPANPSAKYRAVRLALFERVVAERKLNGVILAHHADDQAETVLQRLLRGSGYAGLAGMSSPTRMGDLTILRPLLAVRREVLRAHLKGEGIAWREDASNQSDEYLRNRLRHVLSHRPELRESLLALAASCGELRDWARATAPALPEQFRMAALANLPGILAGESARRWLIDRGVPVDQIGPATIQRLIEMAADAASAPRVDFPGDVRISRRRGMIQAERLLG